MFSGIGGFEYGIQRAILRNRGSRPKHRGSTQGLQSSRPMPTIKKSPFTCIGYSEIDKYAIKVYERHFGGHKNYGDATKINPKELPDFDLLVGGFPCQAFSIAGKRKGFDDTRGTLFFDIARILAEKRPRHLVLENVKGLLSHDGGKTFQTILGVLSDLGYGVEWQILNSKDFGVPQNRERIIIVGHLGEQCGRKVFPIGVDTGEIVKPIKRKRITTGRTRNFGSSGQLHAPDEVCSTLTTSMGTGGNNVPNILNSRIRRLTPKECERLQGFPDDWTKYGINDEPISDTQRYKMCGNAVTTNVITAVMEKLL